jgi:pilus assembly protein Flp/PilA
LRGRSPSTSKFVSRFARNESGATAIEYGLIVALIFLAILAGISMFANNEVNMYNHVATTVSGSTH